LFGLLLTTRLSQLRLGAAARVAVDRRKLCLCLGHAGIEAGERDLGVRQRREQHQGEKDLPGDHRDQDNSPARLLADCRERPGKGFGSGMCFSFRQARVPLAAMACRQTSSSAISGA
jgi:hypothetical protein